MELKLLAVAVGGAVGACTRYVVSQWAAGRFGADFPYGTLIVNVVGCFIIGVFLTAGLFSKVLAQVFDRAVHYKQENDLTI